MKKIETLEKLCKKNNVKFTYISKWSAVIDLPTKQHPQKQIKVDIDDIDEINMANTIVNDYINGGAKW